MSLPFHRPCVALAPILFAVSSPAQDSLSEALASAAEDNLLTLLLVTMPDTRGSREVGDPSFVSECGDDLVTATHVVLYQQLLGQKSPLQAKVEKLFLSGPGRDYLVAPQAVFLRPSGKVLAAVPGAMTRGQLEWAWANALTEWNSSAPVGPRSGAARPPAHYTSSAMAWRAIQVPPDGETMERLLVAASKASTFMGLQQQGLQLARSADARARKVYAATLGLCDEKSRIGFLERVQMFSPPEWGEVVAPFLKVGSPNHRIAVADTLCAIRSKAAVPELVKALRKKQKSPGVHRAILCALVASDPTYKSSAKLLARALKSREHGDRVNAMMAAIPLEIRDAAVKLLASGLEHKDTKTRLAAAYAAAMRDERAIAPVLRAALEAETDDAALEWLDTCLKVLDGDAERAELGSLKTQLTAE